MPSGRVAIGEHRAAVVAAQRDVDVAAVAFALIEFRHERQALAVLVGDLLGAVLVDRVVVTGDQRVVVAERDLLLAEVALALDALAVHARAVHAEPDVAQQRLHPGRGQHRVVDVVVGGRCQAAVAGGPRLAEGVVEDDELEFGAHVGHQPLVGQPGDLLVEDAARRLGHRVAVGPGQVGHDQRGARQPRQQAQRGEIRRHHHVAVAGFPAATSRSRRRCSCRRRRRAGSCSIRRRGRRCPRRTAAPRLVCRSAGPAYRRTPTITVSMSPAAINFSNSFWDSMSATP